MLLLELRFSGKSSKLKAFTCTPASKNTGRYVTHTCLADFSGWGTSTVNMALEGFLFHVNNLCDSATQSEETIFLFTRAATQVIVTQQ